MKKTVILSLMVILTSSIFASNLDAQWNCSVEGYVGPDGTSCLYKQGGCYYRVTHHRILFGLFTWNTEEKVSCDEPRTTGIQASTDIN
jgi:nicotinamide mononucleotide (NMN) deamidase PncC